MSILYIIIPIITTFLSMPTIALLTIYLMYRYIKRLKRKQKGIKYEGNTFKLSKYK
jgi:1,4-dihydroxy-2-naphthoate octaprenyltransferase